MTPDAQLKLALEAVEAMVAWFDSESELAPKTTTFADRMDLCAYAEHMARKALGQDVGEFRGVPRLVLQFKGDSNGN